MISIDKVKHFFGQYSPKPAFSAETVVDTGMPPKKLKNKQVSIPSYLKSASAGNSVLPEADKQTANIDLTAFRYGASTKDTIRSFSQVDPDMSAAMAASARLAITSNYTLIAYDVDGRINEEGTKIAQQLARKFDFLSDYSLGFSKFKDIRSIAESLAKEITIEGSCALELVLDKGRYPAGFKAISTSQIDFKADSEGSLLPVQVLSGDEVDLNIPTFFYVSLDQSLLEPYSNSPVEPALHATISLQEFQNDLRKIFKKVIHPRSVTTILEDKWIKTVPQDILNDQTKLQAFREATITAIKNDLNGLNPEDMLVISDVLTMTTLNTENSSTSDEYKTLSGLLNQKSAAGNKTLPGILGHDSTSSANIASTQAMMFMKSVEGAVQEKLNTIFSRAFTLAVRLYGQDVIVKFQYERIELRPTLEMEAFKAMRQARIMENLSTGLISDIEASILLTGSLPPDGAPKLSGTFFKTGSSAGGNPDASPSDGASPGEGSAVNQNLAPDTPTQPKTG